MAPAGKDSGFHKHGNDWFYKAGLPSDIIISVDGVNFHLHRFPLISKCGKMARIHEESKNVKTLTTTLEEFPGGHEAFLIAAKFCYGIRIEFTPKNIVTVYCAADYLEMTEDLGEGNLIAKAETFFYKAVLHNWKDCILTLQSSEALMERADKLRIVDRCLNALSVMVCTDPSLFGWPMMMYGSLQSPGGSILWNGINTGARIRSSESDWWFEDISYLGIVSFQRLIKAMESKGIRPENIVGAIMYYARKYLPGLGRWQSSGVVARTVTSFNLKPAALDQRLVLESIEKLLPQRKGKSFCRFLLGLLRVGIILGVEKPCLDSLEKRIGTQMEMATLDGLLIPSYSDSDTLYDTETVLRIVKNFVSSAESRIESFSPASAVEASPSSSPAPMRKVAKLVDSYIAEVASDVNLKPAKVRCLAEAVPGSARALQDGLYRSIDIYLKAHPWLSEREKEELCNVIEFERLSIDACAHASQNNRLPLRIVLQVLFFEQMHLRTALTGCLNLIDTDDVAAPAPPGPTAAEEGTVGWVSVARENRALKGDMARMRSRVGELEEEFGKIKDEMKKVTKSHSSIVASPRFAIARRMGCKLLNPRPSEPEIVNATPRASSAEQPPRPSGNSKHHRKSFSLF